MPFSSNGFSKKVRSGNTLKNTLSSKHHKTIGFGEGFLQCVFDFKFFKIQHYLHDIPGVLK